MRCNSNLDLQSNLPGLGAWLIDLTSFFIWKMWDIVLEYWKLSKLCFIIGKMFGFPKTSRSLKHTIMMKWILFSDKPVSIDAGNNEHIHKDNKINKKQQKNRTNYKKTNPTTIRNDMKKRASTTTTGMLNKDHEKSTVIEIVKPNMFKLSSKTLSRYQTNILLRGLKFTPIPKRNNIELIYHTQLHAETTTCWSFSKTKKQTILRTFFKNNLTLPHLEIGI